MRNYLVIGLLLISTTLSGCAFVAGACAAGVVTTMVAKDRRDIKTMRQDHNITYQAERDIHRDKALKNSHIVVATFNRTVLLAGQALTQEQKQEAENIIKAIPNVKRIYNEISISGPISPLTISSDSWITAKIQSKVVADKILHSSQVKIVTEDGVVYIMGIVTHRQADRVVEIAKQTVGVRQVVRLFEYPTDV